MKKSVSLLTLVLAMAGLYIAPASGCTKPHTVPVDSNRACTLLTRADAEKILGQSIEIAESASEMMGNVIQSRCNYAIDGVGAMDGLRINFYFSIEQRHASSIVTSAHDYYTETYAANAKNSPLETLTGTGDEAYLQKNPPYLYFILIRKGDWIVRIKINKAPPTISIPELKAWAKRVADRL